MSGMHNMNDSWYDSLSASRYQAPPATMAWITCTSIYQFCRALVEYVLPNKDVGRHVKQGKAAVCQGFRAEVFHTKT